jgi:hypothetical protein
MDATDIISIYAVVQDNNYARSAASVVIQTDDTGANGLVTIGTPPTIATQAADAAASVALGLNQTVGATGDTTLTLTLPVALDADDTIELTFPASMNVASAAFSSETFSGAGTISGCAVASQLVTCTAGGAITAGTRQRPM